MIVVAGKHHGANVEDIPLCYKCDIALRKKELPFKSIRPLDVKCFPLGLEQVVFPLVEWTLVGFVVTSSYMIIK
jgi:hypothetical protein